MNSDEKENWQNMFSAIDGLYRKVLAEKAWTMTFYNRLAELESKQLGKPVAEVKAQLSKRQKECYQKLLERVEKMDPSYAALLDDRDIGDVL